MVWQKRDDTVVHELDPYNAEPACAALDGHPLTPLDTFYSRNHGPIPTIEPDRWRLRLDGLLDHPTELSLDQLQTQFDTYTITATLQCAGARRADLIAVRDIPGEAPWGPCATSTARWTGVALADVLAAAGLRNDAAHLAFEGPDLSQIPEPPQTYGSSIPRAKATSSEVLLAWAMNDQPLPTVHGGPVRVVVPGYIGARSVKWVNRITAQTAPSSNYFQATAYRLLPAEADPTTAGPGDGLSLSSVALNSDILNPADGATVRAGSTRLSGYAYAGDDRTIARVDVSIDHGATWQQSDLDSTAGPWTWTLWQTTLDLRPGTSRILVRAWDSTGAAQPEDPGPLWNPKGYINNSWGHIALTVTDHG